MLNRAGDGKERKASKRERVLLMRSSRGATLGERRLVATARSGGSVPETVESRAKERRVV
jgi:hypothetical protein